MRVLFLLFKDKFKVKRLPHSPSPKNGLAQCLQMPFIRSLRFLRSGILLI
jgi:hypothetical protein